MTIVVEVRPLCVQLEPPGDRKPGTAPPQRNICQELRQVFKSVSTCPPKCVRSRLSTPDTSASSPRCFTPAARFLSRWWTKPCWRVSGTLWRCHTERVTRGVSGEEAHKRRKKGCYGFIAHSMESQSAAVYVVVLCRFPSYICLGIGQVSCPGVSFYPPSLSLPLCVTHTHSHCHFCPVRWSPL